MKSKHKLLIITIELFFLLFLIAFNILPQKTYTVKYDKHDKQILSDMIYDNRIINQEFKSKFKTNSFSLKIGTYRHFYKDAIMNIEIEDLNNNEKKKFSINCFSLDDREETIIDYPLKKNHNYLMKISTKGISKENSFIFYSTKYKNKNNYKLIIDGEEKNYNLVIGYNKKSFTKSNYWVLILYFSLNFCIFSLFIKEQK